MRILLALLALVPSLLTAQNDDGAKPIDKPRGTLKCADGAVLHGTPDGFDEDGNLKWRAKTLAEPLAILPSSIVQLNLRDGVQPKEDGEYRAVLSLNNGDVLHGQLETLTDTHVTLKTWFGGSMKIRRTMASGLEILAGEHILYHGPVAFDSWKVTGKPGSWKLDDRWKVDDRSLRSTGAGSIAREFDLPDKCRFGFDLRWQNSLRFRLLFRSDDGKTVQPDNCYDFVCQRRFVYLRKRWMTPKSGGSRILGQANVAALEAKESVHFDFYLDRVAGTISLYVDGVEVERWTDPDPDVGAFGKWVQFIAEDFYPVQVSRIRLAPWDGEFPEKAEAPAEIEKGEGEVFLLRKGDHLVGKVKEIKDGVLHIESKAGVVTVPIETLSAINFPPGEYEEPQRKKSDIRARTPDGSVITFQLDSFGKDTLKGHSQTFGDAEFKLDAFRRLDFNLYDEELEKLRNGKGE